MEQLIGSKLGKEYDKAVNCPPAYLTYKQNTVCIQNLYSQRTIPHFFHWAALLNEVQEENYLKLVATMQNKRMQLL